MCVGDRLVEMGGRKVALFVICLFLALSTCQAAKRRYFKFGGNWKSWNDDTNALSKSRAVSGRRSLPDPHTVHTEIRDVLENSQVELACGVDRERYPNVRWSRYGQSLPESVQEKDDKLIFPAIQLGDAGTYVCTASNEWDTKEIQIKLTVHPSDRFREQVGSTAFQCRPDQATCRTGECIDRSALCDGRIHCRDGSDEQNCGQSLQTGDCQPNEFKCVNGRCIQRMWYCDGDDDCEDRSDEASCGQRQPGQFCAPYEFTCHSQRQCVPLAYQCDKNNDCHDGSDEIGCTGPTVVEPPKRDVQVRCGETITLTCRTIGVPIPYVNWRLNWGPVCGHPRCQQSSVNGVGTLTITNAQDIDQGAYTCEAVNVMNRVLATPDAIVRVYGCGTSVIRDCIEAGTLPDVGDGVCHCKQQTTGRRCESCVSGAFYLSERNAHGCIKCFCSGVTTQCDSSSWYRTQERLTFMVDDQDVFLTDREKTAPVIDFDHVSYREYITHPGRQIGTLYWHLPQRMLGNKITAYGGRLTFKFRYSGSGQLNQQPLVILRGNGITVVYHSQQSFAADVVHEIVIEMYETSWRREDGQPMTREHFLMTLAGLDTFLIRATHAEQGTSSSLGAVSLDIAAPVHTQQDRAWAVEECRCPPGYQGLSCEECAPGYVRSGGGLWLGSCVRQGPLAVRIDPRIQELAVGGTIRFRAIVEGAVGPFTFIWIKVGLPSNQPLPLNAVAVGELLTLTGGRVEDAGTYRVVVTSLDARGTAEAELRIRATPLSIIVEPRSQEQDEGTTVRFRAVVVGGGPGPSGQGAFTYQWSKVGYPAQQPLPNNAVVFGEILTLNNVRLEDYGTYRVVVSFVGGTGAADAELRVRRVGVCPYVWVEPLSAWHGEAGERVELHCKALGEPTPRLYWRRADGRPLDVNAVDRGDGTLVIENVGPNNYGQYICYGENRAGTNSVNATVSAGAATERRIIIRMEPSNTIASKRYDTVQARCVAIGTPTPTVTWRREDGSPLHSNAQDLGDGTLRILGIEKINAGLYRCTARNAYFENTDIVNILPPTDIRSALPIAVVSPREIDASIGDEIRVDCAAIVDSRDPPARLVWSKESGRPLDEDAKHSGDGILRISSFQQHHADVYECTAFGEHSKAIEKATLRVKPESGQAPMVPEVTPKIQTVAEGDKTEFSCKSDGTPPPMLKWGFTAADGLLPRNVYEQGDGRLLVEMAENSLNEGQYFCTATNAFGSVSASGSLYVESAPVAPKVKIAPQTEWKGSTGESFIFECTAKGIPTPNIVWAREDNGPFGEGVKVDEEGRLVITNANKTDSGKYICTASNSAGVDWAIPTVEIESALVSKIMYDGKEASDVITVEENSPFKLECLGFGDPAPTVGWTVDVGPSRGDVPEGYKPVEIYNQFVMHSGVSRANEGVYKCETTNGLGTAEDTVKVQVVPRGKRQVVILGSNHQIAGPGDRVELRCLLADPTSKYSLKWTRKTPVGAALPVQDHTIEGLLVLPHFAETDAGVYECQAWTESGSELVASEEKQISSVGADDQTNVINVGSNGPIKRVMAGDNLELNCSAAGPSNNGKAELQWFLVNKGDFRPVTRGSTIDGVLRITNVSLDDAGIYSCVRYVDDQRNGSYQVAVIVSNTEIRAKQVYPEYSSLVELQCPVFPISGMIYEWKRVNELQLPVGAIANNRFLRIPEFKPEHVGTYACEVKINGKLAIGYIQALSPGENNKVAEIRRPLGVFGVTQQQTNTTTFPPTTVSLKAEGTTKSHMELKMEATPDFAFPSKDVTLKCSVDDDPTARIHWERIGRPLPRTAYVTGEQLKLRKLQAGDTGRYRCSATTKLGQMSVETVVKIGEKLSGNVVRRYYD